MESKATGLGKLAERWSGLMKSKNAPRVIVALGLLGMALILLSSFLPDEKTNAAKTQPSGLASAGFEQEDYAGQLAQSLEAILSKMSGVGEVKVLVTLKQDAEYVYAKDTKSTLDSSEGRQGESGVSTQSKENREEEYLIIDGSSGKQALLTTRFQPQVQGVVVVCTGGSDPTVAARVTDAVTTALGVGSSRVCVSPLG